MSDDAPHTRLEANRYGTGRTPREHVEHLAETLAKAMATLPEADRILAAHAVLIMLDRIALVHIESGARLVVRDENAVAVNDLPIATARR